MLRLRWQLRWWWIKRAVMAVYRTKCQLGETPADALDATILEFRSLALAAGLPDPFPLYQAQLAERARPQRERGRR
jgi:hypothetical protein